MQKSVLKTRNILPRIFIVLWLRSTALGVSVGSHYTTQKNSYNERNKPEKVKMYSQGFIVIRKNKKKKIRLLKKEFPSVICYLLVIHCFLDYEVFQFFLFKIRFVNTSSSLLCGKAIIGSVLDTQHLIISVEFVSFPTQKEKEENSIYMDLRIYYLSGTAITFCPGLKIYVFNLLYCQKLCP